MACALHLCGDESRTHLSSRGLNMNMSRTDPVRTHDASPLLGAGIGLLLMTAMYAWDLLSVNWLGWFLRLMGMA